MLFCKKIQGTYVYLLESFENLKKSCETFQFKKKIDMCVRN